MTEEHLKKIIKISEEVKRYKDFLKSLNNSYVNQIIACDWSGGKVGGTILLLENEPELEQLIKGYISKKIEILEKEFAEL
ncbi:MAG: hypothetical protein ACLUEC_10370 [Coprococcus sp.]